MAYRPSFACLWCGDTWTTRGPDDLEGWAQLCPTCLGRAGSNQFLRGRLRSALEARAAAGGAGARAAAAEPGTVPATAPGMAPGTASATALGTSPGRPAPARPASVRPSATAFPDGWFLRRGAYERGAVHDTAWAAELDVVTRWLDGVPLAGRILELAAGVGFFSPLLAERGELFAFDADGEALAIARARLVAHRLRAHLHVADPWGPLPPDADPTPADGLVAAFLVGRVRGAGLDAAADSLRGRLRRGGSLALVDLRPDAAGGPPEGVAWSWPDPSVVEAALLRAGFAEVTVTTSGRFFLVARGTAR